MKKVLIALAVWFVLSAALMYGIGTFVKWEPNPMLWGPDSRRGAAITWLIVFIFTAPFATLLDDED